MYERSLRIFAWISYIRAFWLGSMISILFLKYVGLGDVEISLFHAVMGAAIFCLELPTGVLADRYGYRASIIAGTGFLALAFASFLLAAAYGELVIFFGTAAFFSLSSSLYSGAANAYVYSLLDHGGRRSEYIAYQSRIASRTRAIEAVAIVAGACLYAQAEYLPYLLQTVFMAGAFVLSFALAPEPLGERKAGISRLTAGALRKFASNKLYPLSLVFLVIAVLPYQYFHHVVNQSVFEESGLGIYGIGLAGMAIYLASGLMLRWVPALHARLGDEGALLALMAATAVAGIGFLADGSIYGIVAWSIVLYAAGGALLIVFDNVIQESMEWHDHRASISSLLSMFSSPVVKALFVGVGVLSGGMPYAVAMGWLCLGCASVAIALVSAYRLLSPAYVPASEDFRSVV